MLDKKAKEKIIKKFKTHESDTGSTQIQVAILTEEIKQLTDHLKQHKKDFSSRRGLLKKVTERRKLLLYLKHEDADGYQKLAKELKLKIAKLFEEDDEKARLEELEETGVIEAVVDEVPAGAVEAVPEEPKKEA
ncbi:MAG: 30S ribosomal protein S15 [Parcubacteria group bacterium GW2011_GWA2_38_13]|nr:MAG: 30S ribosomal protein S15 [Parcubacteria group bacterium GW2011_GWA2_38_13]